MNGYSEEEKLAFSIVQDASRRGSVLLIGDSYYSPHDGLIYSHIAKAGVDRVLAVDPREEIKTVEMKIDEKAKEIREMQAVIGNIIDVSPWIERNPLRSAHYLVGQVYNGFPGRSVDADQG